MAVSFTMAWAIPKGLGPERREKVHSQGSKSLEKRNPYCLEDPDEDKPDKAIDEVLENVGRMFRKATRIEFGWKGMLFGWEEKMEPLVRVGTWCLSMGMSRWLS